MLQETLLNAEGYKELQDELENLKTVGRKEAAEKIKIAKRRELRSQDNSFPGSSSGILRV